MSVPVYRRNESAVQFLETARELEIYTLRYCSKFPKRFMFLITKHIVELAQSVYDNAKASNSVYPVNKEEEALRIGYVTRAICDLECLASQLEIAHEAITHFETGTPQNSKTKAIQPKVWEGWSSIMVKELRLLKSLRKSLCDKYKGKD